VVNHSDVVYANTILTHTEYLMPAALGEFGKAKDSDIAHKVLQMLEAASAPLTMLEMWPQIQPDLNDYARFSDMLMNLTRASKIQFAGGGYLRKKVAAKKQDSNMVDFSMLTDEERKYHHE
jgi:hypothetical protein